MKKFLLFGQVGWGLVVASMYWSLIHTSFTGSDAAGNGMAKGFAFLFFYAALAVQGLLILIAWGWSLKTRGLEMSWIMAFLFLGAWLMVIGGLLSQELSEISSRGVENAFAWTGTAVLMISGVLAVVYSWEPIAVSSRTLGIAWGVGFALCLGLQIFTAQLIGRGSLFSVLSREYAWSPEISNAPGFPIVVVRSAFLNADGSANPLLVRDQTISATHWGEGFGSYTPSFQQVPKRLEITWFSIREDKFYSGAVELPVEKMTALFSAAHGKLDSYDSGPLKYDTIKIGLAPGGQVTVWMSAIWINTEIARFKAEETKMDWREFRPDSERPRAAFIREELDQVFGDEKRAHLRNLPIDPTKWEKIAWRMPWHVAVASPLPLRHAVLTGQNGEVERVFGESGGVIFPTVERQAPQSLAFELQGPGKLVYRFRVEFDEPEVLKALHFARDRDPTPTALTRIMVTPNVQSDGKASLHVGLISSQESIPLQGWNWSWSTYEKP